MSLIDLHIELAQTNTLLSRIADALDRAYPVASAVRPAHPLIGPADISRMTPQHAAEVSARRDTMPYHDPGASRIFKPSDEAGSSVPETAAPSFTGARDHEDPLDDLEAMDSGWPNYAGVDT